MNATKTLYQRNEMVLHKYSGSGNDFLISHSFMRKNRSDLAKRLCERHSGIGADGLVVLLPHNEYAYEWEFYNCDGSQAKMCGNASLCVAHYAYMQGLAGAKHNFLTGAGEVRAEVFGERVRSDLGKYRLLDCFELNIPKYSGTWYLIDMGVVHLVHFLKNADELPQEKNSLLVELRQRYDANVNLAVIHLDGSISLRTYERGVEDITLACGTGMAAVFVASLEFLTTSQATLISLSGARLSLMLEGENILYEGGVKCIGICIIEEDNL